MSPCTNSWAPTQGGEVDSFAFNCLRSREEAKNRHVDREGFLEQVMSGLGVDQ